LVFRVNGQVITPQETSDIDKNQPTPKPNTLSTPKEAHPLDGWKPATERSKDNIEGAVYEKMYGGTKNMPLYEMTIAERDSKYIPYHGGVAMDECETIIQAAKAIDTYYNELAPEHKYCDLKQAQAEEPQLYKFQIRGYEDSHPETYMLGLGTIENPSFQTIDNNSFFTGTLKHELYDRELSEPAEFNAKSDTSCLWNGVYRYGNDNGDCYHIYSTAIVDSLPITNITLVKQQEQTHAFPSLTPTEAKELTDFTTAVTKAYPAANPESLHQLCTIANEMAKLTNQNARGTLSNEKYNSLTDAQEKQVNKLLKDLLYISPLYSYDEKAPAIELKMPSRQSDVENCIVENASVFRKIAVPEIPKNKLTVAPEAVKSATDKVTKQR
jgi:hypothetical protein